MKTMTLKEFQAEYKAQGVGSREEVCFICPMCGAIQNGKDFIDAGVGADFDAVEKYVGFSCIGRFTSAGSPRKDPDGKPCNWTLGGMFKLHKMEVLTEDGNHHPVFELATPEQAAEKVKGGA